MNRYEIRVAPKAGGGAKIYASTYLNDYAAMRSARMLAKTSDSIEIWRGLNCIYRQGLLPAKTQNQAPAADS